MVVQFLLNKGAAVNHALIQNGFTPLLFACQNGHEGTARLLLEKGAAVDITRNDSFTALLIACQEGHKGTARLLLEKGAAVDLANNTGATALWLACKSKHEAIARLLARRGALINSDDIHEAKKQGKRKLAKWLRRVRGHTTSLHWACEDRDREGMLRGLRSDEFEGAALPPLAELELIARRGKRPTCERSLRLLRLALEPWDVLRRHVWPRSFRDSVAAVADVTRGRGEKAICFTILSFCGRGWWAGHEPVVGDAFVPAPRPAAEVLRRLV